MRRDQLVIRPFPASPWWGYFKNRIPGQQDNRKPNEYHTADYGTVHRNGITNILRDPFGVETKHESAGNVLVFDENIIPVLRRQYADKILLGKKNERYEGSEGSREKAYGNVTTEIMNNQHVENKISNSYTENPINDIKNTTEIVPNTPSFPPGAFTAFTAFTTDAYMRNLWDRVRAFLYADTPK